MDPRIDLRSVEEITKLPTFSVEKELPQQIDDLVVVVSIFFIFITILLKLKNTDLENLPDFLKFIAENSYMQEDLKKRKYLFTYGRIIYI